MRALMRFIDEMPAAAVRVPTFNLAFLPRFAKMSEEEFLAFAESKPLRKEFMLAMGRTGFPEKDMNASLDRMRRTYERMDAAIAQSGGPFLQGARPTLADVSLMPALVRMDDLGLAGMWARPSGGRPLVRGDPRPSRLRADLLRRLAADRDFPAPAGEAKACPRGLTPAAFHKSRWLISAAAIPRRRCRSFCRSRRTGGGEGIAIPRQIVRKRGNPPVDDDATVTGTRIATMLCTAGIPCRGGGKCRAFA